MCSSSSCIKCRNEKRSTVRMAQFQSIPFLLAISQLFITKSCCQCVSGLCEKISLSLNTNTKQNHSLEGYVFEALNLSVWEECFNMCLRKCECLSFNFDEDNTAGNCELNDATTKLAPDALKAKEGVTYYELVRTYYNKNVSTMSTKHHTKNTQILFISETVILSLLKKYSF